MLKWINVYIFLAAVHFSESIEILTIYWALFCFWLIQVLSSLEPLDYVVVAFLPGVSEVHRETWFPSNIVCTLHYKDRPILHCSMNVRNYFSGVHCCHSLDSTGRVPWGLLRFSVFYTWAVAGSIPLSSGNSFSRLDNFANYRVLRILSLFSFAICTVYALWLMLIVISGLYCLQGNICRVHLRLRHDYIF